MLLTFKKIIATQIPLSIPSELMVDFVSVTMFILFDVRPLKHEKRNEIHLYSKQGTPQHYKFASIKLVDNNS